VGQLCGHSRDDRRLQSRDPVRGVGVRECMAMTPKRVPALGSLDDHGRDIVSAVAIEIGDHPQGPAAGALQVLKGIVSGASSSDFLATPSLGPVLNKQPGHPAEVSRVVRDKGESLVQRLRGD
jgi:hypothetical protein